MSAETRQRWRAECGAVDCSWMGKATTKDAACFDAEEHGGRNAHTVIVRRVWSRFCLQCRCLCGWEPSVEEAGRRLDEHRHGDEHVTVLDARRLAGDVAHAIGEM